MTQTRTIYRLNLLTPKGQLSTLEEENGPDCTSIEAAKKTHLDSGDDGRSLVVAAIDQRLGGDGKWYETSAMIQEVL